MIDEYQFDNANAEGDKEAVIVPNPPTLVNKLSANETNNIKDKLNEVIDAVNSGGDSGTVTSVSGVADQITVANGTTTPVIGISSVFANSKANLSGGNSFTGVQNFANDIKLPVNSSVVLGNKFRWVYRSDLNGFSLTTEDVETGTIFIKDTDAKIGLHNTNPQSALDVLGSVRASANDGEDDTLTRNDDVVLRGGTVTGKPINGDLELSNEVSLKVRNANDNGYNSFIFSESFLGLSISDGIFVNNYNFSNAGLEVSSNNPDSKGILGDNLFNKQNDPNAFAQIGDIGTGWASYTSTAHTSGSPLVINSGVTATLPNNAGTVINNQLPIGVSSFYDSTTNKFTPQNDGDYYTVTIRFKALTTAPTAGYLDFGIDIGGALGVQFKETKIFAKGAGIEHNFSIVIPCYTGSTFIANGGLMKLTSGNGNMSVYDINFQFDRTHKAK